jgi:hypothetical protein
MRKNRSKITARLILISILLIVLLISNILIISPTVSAEENQLAILIANLDAEEINSITESEQFKIFVYDPEPAGDIQFLINVNISFNNQQYEIDDTGELTLQAPEVDENTIYTIMASKNGYSTNESNITIINIEEDAVKLKIIPDKRVVESGEHFSLIVTDENDNKISGAEVAIQGYGGSSDVVYTDDDGVAFLVAPEDRTRIVIIAQKEGYTGDKVNLSVNPKSDLMVLLEEILTSPYFLIFVAFIVLLLVIVHVNLRQRKSIYNRAREITEKKAIDKFSPKENTPSEDKEISSYQTVSDEAVRVQPNQDAKVEEIRISRPRKEKEVVSVDSEEDDAEKVINKKQRQRRDYDWFEGTDDMRYEIDKLTGEIDEEGLDKWFEGIGGLKEKIDDRVKKKDKKKKKED